jgi:hypothetical protein
MDVVAALMRRDVTGDPSADIALQSPVCVVWGWVGSKCGGSLCGRGEGESRACVWVNSSFMWREL